MNTNPRTLWSHCTLALVAASQVLLFAHAAPAQDRSDRPTKNRVGRADAFDEADWRQRMEKNERVRQLQDARNRIQPLFETLAHYVDVKAQEVAVQREYAMLVFEARGAAINGNREQEALAKQQYAALQRSLAEVEATGRQARSAVQQSLAGLRSTLPAGVGADLTRLVDKQMADVGAISPARVSTFSASDIVIGDSDAAIDAAIASLNSEIHAWNRGLERSKQQLIAVGEHYQLTARAGSDLYAESQTWSSSRRRSGIVNSWSSQ